LNCEQCTDITTHYIIIAVTHECLKGAEGVQNLFMWMIFVHIRFQEDRGKQLDNNPSVKQASPQYSNSCNRLLHMKEQERKPNLQHDE